MKGSFDGPEGYETEWEYLASVLTAAGVPREAILKEDQATYTYENAIFSRRTAEAMGLSIKKAILCCQAFHARRCFLYYQEQFPQTEILVCPTVTRAFPEIPGIRRRRGSTPFSERWNGAADSSMKL